MTTAKDFARFAPGLQKGLNKHMRAILNGEVTKTNVIGLRKALNAEARRSQGYSVSSTAPKLAGKALIDTHKALRRCKPVVTGALHDSGLKLLRSPRYAKRLAAVRDVIDGLKRFRLVGFIMAGDGWGQHYPLYRAEGAGRSFTFYNIPWQSGGDGPQVLHD